MVQNVNPARYTTPSAGAHLPPRRQRQRRQRPTPQRNVERGNAICSPGADDQSSHVPFPWSEGSDAREIRNGYPHTFSPFEMPITIQGGDYVEQGHNVNTADETNYAYIDNSRELRGLPVNRMIREPAPMLPAINEALLETNGYPSVDDPNNTGLPSAFQYSGQFQSAQFQSAAAVSSTIEYQTDPPWSPSPTDQGIFGTGNEYETFNMAFVLPLQGDQRQGPAPRDDQQDAFMFDEGFMASTAHLQLDAESAPPYSDSGLFDQLFTEIDNGYISQFLGMEMTAPPSDSYQPLNNTLMSITPQLGERATIRLNPSGGNLDSTPHLENTMSSSSGSVLKPNSIDTIEFIDPRKLLAPNGCTLD